MANPGFIQNFTASGDVGQFRVAVYTGADFEVTQASGSDAAIAGVTEWGKNISGRVDVVMTQLASIEYGGDILAGDTLVPDAQGRAIKLDMSTKTEDAEVWTLGVAQESGKLGTIGTTTVTPQLIVK
ncbi:hypothetical protein [Pseudoalteromonas luteoviolacea]|uniref:DUF2190 domain-containing protein n=1 Tax=Pseudoalteromonas luteoviolacea S4060-1 TaxID=1365257 RepID=A0A162BVV9_9GAMM|nr:hypothetical protein [Pseudoalteromonas luteoviolacea]KZN69447.1 hypothetical protein N478_12500 [Pseudoalteromonas luteoviolacea S4060-1]